MHRLALLVLLIIPACQSRVRVGDAPPDQTAKVSDVAAGVGESAAKIDAARADAVAKAPQVESESNRIGAETARLRQYQADLNIAVKELAESRKHLDTLTERVSALTRELAEVKAQAEKERTGLLRWIFGGMAGISLVGAVAAVLWLRNMPLAITCIGVVAACIGATYLLAWAKWLAIGLLVLMALATIYVLWRQRQTAKELVLTAESFKRADPADKDAMGRMAEQIQTEATKAFVRLVRDPIKKQIAVKEAFGK